MSNLIVEIGTTKVHSANSYTSLASADQYFELRGATDWVNGDDDLKEASLIKACNLMELMDWKGLKSLWNQPLEWPRRMVVDKNGYFVSATGIPLQIKWIQMEFAYRYFSGNDPFPDQDVTGSIVRERVDVIEVEYERGAEQIPYQPYIDTLLRYWIKSINSLEIVRA